MKLPDMKLPDKTEFREIAFIVEPAEADIIIDHDVQDCLFLCFSVEAYCYVQMNYTRHQCIYALDLIQSELRQDRQTFSKHPDAGGCEVCAFILSHENIVRDELWFFWSIRAIIQKSLTKFGCLKYLVFDCGSDDRIEYNSDSELPLGIHGIIRHYLKRATGRQIEIVTRRGPRIPARWYLPKRAKEIARLCSIILLKVVYISFVLCVHWRTRGRRKEIRVFVGDGINRSYCKELSSNLVRGNAVHIYCSRYHSVLRWLKDVKGDKVFILPLTVPIRRVISCLNRKRAMASFGDALQGHLQVSAGEVLKETVLSRAVLDDLYNRYFFMLTFTAVVSLVRYLKCPASIYSFDAGQAAGFAYLVQSILTTETARHVKAISVFFHGSCDRPFNCEYFSDALSHEKVRMFVRNSIEYDLLVESGVSTSCIWYTAYHPVMADRVRRISGAYDRQRGEAKYERVIREYGLSRKTKKILIVTAGDGWLRCGVNLRAAFDELHRFMLKYADSEDVDIVIKTHPRGDFYFLYLLWAAEVPSLCVVLREENAKNVKEKYRRRYVREEGPLDELIEVCDLVICGPIFNSAVLKAAAYGKDIIFARAGVYREDDFVGRNFGKYFVCKQDAGDLSEYVDKYVEGGLRSTRKEYRNLFCLSGVKYQDGRDGESVREGSQGGGIEGYEPDT
jgi:hypothetical protein